MSEIKVDTLSTVSGSGNIALSNNVAIQSIGKIGIANGDNLFIASDDTNDVGIKFNGDGNRITPSDALGADRGSAIDLGEAGSAPFKDIYLSGGIQFDARSNKLDDYEEGTFTPNVYHSGSNNSTFSTKTGEYTKIGNTVTAQIRVDHGNSGTANGDLTIGGLPFAPAQANGTMTIGIWGANPNSQVGNIFGGSAPTLFKGGVNQQTQITFFTALLVYKTA